MTPMPTLHSWLLILPTASGGRTLCVLHSDLYCVAMYTKTADHQCGYTLHNLLCGLDGGHSWLLVQGIGWARET